MTRGQSYLHRYMAALSYPSLLRAAEEDYETLEEQRRYVDSLIQEERRVRDALERDFAAIQEQRRFFDTSALEGLLQDAQVQQGLRRAAADAQAGTLDAKVLGPLRRAKTVGGPGGLAIASQTLADVALTEAQRATARAELEGLTDAATLDQLFSTLPPPVAGLAPAGVSAAEAEAARLLGELQAAAPTSIAGGAEGEAIAERRRTTAAPKGSSFTTEEDAYRAALASLEDGTLDPGDFASEDDYELAKRLYTEAAKDRAYSNQDALFFERSVLESRARLAELRRRAEDIARPAGLTRQQEVQRLVMERRGFDMDKPLARYQKSPYYNVLLAAEDIYRAGLTNTVERGIAPKGIVVGATDDIQQKVQAHIDNVISDRGLGPLDVPKVEKQLRRGLSLEGDQLQSALAYAIAYNRSRIEGIDSPETAKAALNTQAQARKEQKAVKQDAEDAQRLVKAEEGLARQVEASVQRAAMQQQLTGAREQFDKALEYQRRRAMGEAEDAAKIAAGLAEAPAPAPALPPPAAPAPPPPAEASKLEEERRQRLSELPIEQLRQFAQKGSARAQQVLAEREAAAAPVAAPAPEMTDAERRLAALES